MPALVAGIHVFAAARGLQAWMAGTIGRLRLSSRAMPGHDEGGEGAPLVTSTSHGEQFSAAMPGNDLFQSRSARG
jgi:hypothetical protein